MSIYESERSCNRQQLAVYMYWSVSPCRSLPTQVPIVTLTAVVETMVQTIDEQIWLAGGYDGMFVKWITHMQEHLIDNYHNLHLRLTLLIIFLNHNFIIYHITQ